MFGKVGRVASENVVVELLKIKCLPILLYGLEACPLTKTQLNSLNYVIYSSFRKISMSVQMKLLTSVDTCLTVPTLKIF